MNWLTLRIAYFAKQKDQFLIDGLQPVVNALHTTPEVARVHLARHWKFGPHIDVNIGFNCSDDSRCQQIAEHAKADILAYLARHPSVFDMDEANYLALSEKLGRLELEPGPYLPLLQDNSVMVAQYDNHQKILRSPVLSKVKEDFHSLNSGLLFKLLELKQQDNNAFLMQLVKMLACVGEFYPLDGIKRGHLSFRSHCEHFFAHFDEGKSIRAKYSAFDTSLGNDVDSIIRTTRQAFEQQTYFAGSDTFLADWVRNLFVLKSKLADAAMLNHDEIKDAEHFYKIADDMFGKDHDGQYDFYKDNPFFKVFFETSDTSFFERQEFVVYRAMVNHFYHMLPMLSVSPVQKHLVCSLVANSVERVFNVQWEDLLRGKSAAASQGEAA